MGMCVYTRVDINIHTYVLFILNVRLIKSRTLVKLYNPFSEEDYLRALTSKLISLL